MRVSIIGTAGRKEDGAKMTAEIFELMVHCVEAVICVKWGLSPAKVTLISGGSAWADHVGVKLWLNSMMSSEENKMYRGLELYLPCSVVTSTSTQQLTFQSSSSSSWKDNPGNTLNSLHNSFNNKMGSNFNSYSDLFCAQALGAILNTEHRGFHARNAKVAICDYMIAFTWGESTEKPKAGGTKQTWDLCKSKNKIHIPLHTLNANLIDSILSSTAKPASMFKYFSGSTPSVSSHSVDNNATIWENKLTATSSDSERGEDSQEQTTQETTQESYDSYTQRPKRKLRDCDV